MAKTSKKLNKPTDKKTSTPKTSPTVDTKRTVNNKLKHQNKSAINKTSIEENGQSSDLINELNEDQISQLSDVSSHQSVEDQSSTDQPQFEQFSEIPLIEDEETLYQKVEEFSYEQISADDISEASQKFKQGQGNLKFVKKKFPLDGKVPNPFEGRRIDSIIRILVILAILPPASHVYTTF